MSASEPYLTDEKLRELRRLADAASPGPWRAMLEGRDHEAGDSFIMVGQEGDRDEDPYLHRDSGPASAADYDFLVAARNSINPLLDEIAQLQGEVRGLRGGLAES